VHDKILILDFGSQVTQLIARRVRDARVYSEIHPYDCDPEFIRKFIQEQGGKGIILSGGPSSVTEEGSPRAPQIVFELGVPVLGICYGMQTMATQLGGAVASAVNLAIPRFALMATQACLEVFRICLPAKVMAFSKCG